MVVTSDGKCKMMMTGINPLLVALEKVIQAEEVKRIRRSKESPKPKHKSREGPTILYGSMSLTSDHKRTSMEDDGAMAMLPLLEQRQSMDNMGKE